MKDTDSYIAAPPNLQLDWFLSLTSADSLDTIFHQLVERTREWMRVPRCALWWLDATRNGFRLVSAGEDLGLINQDANFLPYEAAGDLGLLSAEDPTELSPNVTFRLPDFNLTSCLAARIHYDDRVSGILIVFPKERPHSWSEPERKLMHSIARNAAEICRNFEKHDKLTRLVALLQEMSEKSTDYELYDLVLHEGKALFGCDRAVIRRVNLQNGHLTYERSIPNAPHGFSLAHGEDIPGQALTHSQTYRIHDVTTPEWKYVYRPLWPNLPQARSELAVPIMLRKYRVRVKTSNGYVDRPFGVLIFESPTVASFSSFDQYCAETIAQRMATILERTEYDKKLGKVRRASESLATKRDWDSVVDTLLAAIQDILGYEFVSLSIVDHDTGMLRCVRAVGIPDADEFRKAASHRLDSTHVQADVVRRGGHVEVPSPDDPRLSAMSEQFGLDRLIRVFIPMIASSRNEVIGTIAAGYDRTYRKHIYWRDVQLLRMLATFGAGAMELSQRGKIDRVSHEINAPLTAIRANLERLRAHRNSLSDEQIERNLEDMETDTNLLYYQVKQLEYTLGGAVTEGGKQLLHTEPVLLFRDIIIKTVSQLRPLVRDKGLDPRAITYTVEDIYKIGRIYVDKSRISQVIFNLFMNAVKYAESPETFKIHIGAEVLPDYYIIKFCDWGIGIQAGLEDKIFQEGFRAPSVREVIGSGLGLTIARQVMREHGGDLILRQRHKPTEFHLILPRRLKRTT